MIHLIYLHQGHFGRPSQLVDLARKMSNLLDGESYIAMANASPLDTAYGIDIAAQRASEELTELLQSRPTVKSLSLVGVSLGGCILERVADIMYRGVFYPLLSNIRSPNEDILDHEDDGIDYHYPESVKLRYFITFASPLNGIGTTWWSRPGIAAALFGWLDITLQDLVDMHGKTRDSVAGIVMFEKRICLGNLVGDWRVPISSAFPVGGDWPWSVGSHRVVQRALDESSCIWHTVTLDLSDRWWTGVHRAIVDDQRSMNAIRKIIHEDDEDSSGL